MKRKKQKRLLFILLILFLAACAGYFFLLRYNEEQEKKENEEETDTSVSIYPEDFDSSAISSISYDYQGTPLSFSLKNDKETWQYDENTDFPLNQSSLTGMSSQLQSLTASRKIMNNLDTLADYGLDEPVSQVTANDSDGTELTIYFGNTNDAAGVTYIYTSASENIYTIDSGVRDYFSHPLLDMIVEDELPLPDSTAVYQDITISRNEKTSVFRYKEEGDTELDYLNRCSWFADMDGDQFAMDDTAVSDLTGALSSLATSGCAAYGITSEEMSVYGLDQPSAVITVNYTQTETVEAEEKTQENSSDSSEIETEEETEAKTEEVAYQLNLKIGNAVEDYYYVTWNDLSQVYLMSASSLDTFLNCDKFTLMYKEPFNFSVDSIAEMEIKYQDLSFLYKIEHTRETAETTDENGETSTEEKEVTQYTLNGQKIDSGEFTDLLGTIQNMAAEKLYPTEEGNAPIGDEAITLYVKLNQEKRGQVELILTPYDNNYYALYVDQTPVYLMNKTDVSSFIDALPVEEKG